MYRLRKFEGTQTTCLPCNTAPEWVRNDIFTLQMPLPGFKQIHDVEPEKHLKVGLRLTYDKS